MGEGASSSSDRGAVESLALAGLGALTLAAERLDELAEEVASRLGIDREEVRAALVDTIGSWRREGRRLGEQAAGAPSRFAGDLGLATRDELDELALRVAQVEHRLKLLERER